MDTGTSGRKEATDGTGVYRRVGGGGPLLVNKWRGMGGIVTLTALIVTVTAVAAG
jgi:hypothetical protein